MCLVTVTVLYFLSAAAEADIMNSLLLHLCRGALPPHTIPVGTRTMSQHDSVKRWGVDECMYEIISYPSAMAPHPKTVLKEIVRLTFGRIHA